MRKITQLKSLFYYLGISFLLLFIQNIVKASNVPETGTHVQEAEYNFRIFMKKDNINFMGETLGRFEGSDKEFRKRSLTLGPYLRLHSNLKIGGFYRLQQGVWHDDDWIFEDDDWKWRDTTSRSEHLFLFDMTPRVALSFLPGRNWVAEMKNRYIYNTFNDHQTITVRPGITYFWLDNFQPFINFYLQYEIYFPLNYGTTLIYERWIYLGALYHVNSMIKLGIYGAERQVIWGSSKDFKERFPDKDYEMTYKTYMIGVSAILTFSI